MWPGRGEHGRSTSPASASRSPSRSGAVPGTSSGRPRRPGRRRLSSSRSRPSTWSGWPWVTMIASTGPAAASAARWPVVGRSRVDHHAAGATRAPAAPRCWCRRASSGPGSGAPRRRRHPRRGCATGIAPILTPPCDPTRRRHVPAIAARCRSIEPESARPRRSRRPRPARPAAARPRRPRCARAGRPRRRPRRTARTRR